MLKKTKYTPREWPVYEAKKIEPIQAELKKIIFLLCHRVSFCFSFLFHGSVETILFKICHFHRSSFFCEKYWKIFSPRTHFEWKHLTLTDAAVNFDWIRLSGLDKAVLSGHHGSSPGSGKGLYVKKGLEQNKRSDH